MRTQPLMEFSYRPGRDGMLYPQIQISEDPEDDRMPAGRFGQRWKAYMMENHPHRLSELAAQGRISEMVRQVDQEAEQRKEEQIQALLASWPAPETGNTMERAGHMNMITRQAEETVMAQVVLKIR